MIELTKNLGPSCLPDDMTSAYLLENIHRNISHPTVLKTCFSLLELICKSAESYSRVIMAEGSGSEEPVIPYFIQDCLLSYSNIVKSEQKKYLKALDIDLILTVLKLSNLILEKCPPEHSSIVSHLAGITPLLTEIIEYNEDIQIHIATTICLKSMIRLCPKVLQQKEYQKNIAGVIRCLLKIPADKTFEGASIYVGNLSILSFNRLF